MQRQLSTKRHPVAVAFGAAGQARALVDDLGEAIGLQYFVVPSAMRPISEPTIDSIRLDKKSKILQPAISP